MPRGAQARRATIIVGMAIIPIGAGPSISSPIGLIPSAVPAATPCRGPGLAPFGAALPGRTAGPARLAVRNALILGVDDRRSFHVRRAGCRWVGRRRARRPGMNGERDRASDCREAHKPWSAHARVKPFCESESQGSLVEHIATQRQLNSNLQFPIVGHARREIHALQAHRICLRPPRSKK